MSLYFFRCSGCCLVWKVSSFADDSIKFDVHLLLQIVALEPVKELSEIAGMIQ